MKIKSIIVDDEKHDRENLAGILRQYCPDVDFLGEAVSVDAAFFFGLAANSTAGLLALGIALLSVSWQCWKAATRNPVEALRYE